MIFGLAEVGCVVLSCGLEERVGAIDVGAEEGLGAVDGAIDVALRGEMYDSTGIVLLEKAGDQFGIADVALDEEVVWICVNSGEVCGVARVGELVEIDYGAAACGQPVEYEVGADEACSAGYKDRRSFAVPGYCILFLGHAVTDASKGAQVFQTLQ